MAEAPAEAPAPAEFKSDESDGEESKADAPARHGADVARSDGSPRRSAPPSVEVGPLLNTLSMEATAHLLAGYFHVDGDVVQQGFRNVDGATLAFYTDDELEKAGIANAPLRRRIVQELARFSTLGVPPAAQRSSRDAVTSPTQPGHFFPNELTPTSQRVAPLPAEAVEVYPAITASRPQRGRFASPHRSQSGFDAEAERRARQRRILSHNSGAQSTSALDTRVAPDGDDRPSSADRGPGFLRRRSRELTNFFKGFRKSHEDGLPSRRDGRLAGELKRYAVSLPAGITSVEPIPTARSVDEADNDEVRWRADVLFGKQQSQERVTIRIPPNYPFAGPVCALRDREVRFVMGQGGVQDAFDIVCVWTPAMSVCDAITETLDAVRQAEYTESVSMFSEEETLSRCTSAPSPESDADDRRRAPAPGAAEAKA